MHEIDKIHVEFGTHLLNYITSKVPNPEDASDIYQDLLVKVIKKIDHLKKQESLKSWLFSIAHHQIVDFYRSNKNYIVSESLEHSLYQEEQQHSAAYSDMVGCLNNFIKMLPEDDREIIRQSEIQGISQKELAASLNMNYTTLRSKVQRGRNKLKDLIYEACVIEKDVVGTVVECTPKNTGSSSSCNTSSDAGCA